MESSNLTLTWLIADIVKRYRRSILLCLLMSFRDSLTQTLIRKIITTQRFKDSYKK